MLYLSADVLDHRRASVDPLSNRINSRMKVGSSTFSLTALLAGGTLRNVTEQVAV